MACGCVSGQGHGNLYCRPMCKMPGSRNTSTCYIQMGPTHGDVTPRVYYKPTRFQQDSASVHRPRTLQNEAEWCSTIWTVFVWSQSYRKSVDDSQKENSQTSPNEAQNWTFSIKCKRCHKIISELYKKAYSCDKT